MRKLSVALCLLLLAGCVSMEKIEKGDRAVGDRLSVKIEGSWNHLQAPNLGPAEVWTQEGITVDELLLYSGIKDEQVVHIPDRSGKTKDFAFRSKMQPDEIASMFEGMLTRDGSSYKLTKLEPMTFAGTKGFHFEFEMTRKIDNVVLLGSCWGAVSKGELFAILYKAPRLVFYSRHAAQVEKIAQSATLKP